MSDVTLTKDDAGETVTVHVGDVLEIRLPENPTTGYRWAIEDLDERVLRLESSEFTPGPGGGIGSGGTRVFRVVAQDESPAPLNIRLKLWREWEGNSSVTDRFEVAARVLR